MKFNIKQVSDILDGEVEGDLNAEVWTLSKIEEGKQGAITFLNNPKYIDYVYTTKATAIIVDKDFIPQKPITANLIRVKDPYKSFIDLLSYYKDYTQKQKKGIEAQTVIGENTIYGEDFYMASFVYIGNNVTIGDNVKIYPHVYIGDNVKIGDDVIIYSGAKIYNEVCIGSRCIINSGCVVGSDGFGFIPDETTGKYTKIPHVGNVIIEDDVDLGACVTIDRATMGSTLIKKGVKLDNQVHLAHNVLIDENTAMAAQVGIAGSTKIGKNCVVGGQVGIAGHVKIGDKTQIQAQSGVVKNIKEEGTAIQGTPAFDYKKFNKAYVYFRKLPEIIKELEASKNENNK